MKKRKIRISGDVTRSHQKDQPVIGPRCQRAVIECPLAARTAMPAANASQNPTAMNSSLSRERMASPPTTMRASASAIQTDIGPHQKSSGSARAFPSARKQRTSPKFEGLKRCRPWKRMRCFERSDTAAVEAKIHQPCMLHQSPCSVPGTRRMKATPFPVRSALAGHMRIVLAEERDPDLEQGARPERDEDLGDREAEPEDGLPEHLQRDDHHGEMQARIADRGQQDGVAPSPDRHHRPAGEGGRAHGTVMVLPSVSGRASPRSSPL